MAYRDDYWRTPEIQAGQSKSYGNLAADMADPWAKYRPKQMETLNNWTKDPSSLPWTKYQFDKGMEGASRGLQKRGATGGGRLAALQSEGQGLAQSTALPWLDFQSKLAGVDKSSPSNAALVYSDWNQRSQNQKNMAAANKNYEPNGGGGGGGTPWWMDQSRYASQDRANAELRDGGDRGVQTFTYGGGQDPRTMTLAQLNAYSGSPRYPDTYTDTAGRSRQTLIQGGGFPRTSAPPGGYDVSYDYPGYDTGYGGYGGGYDDSSQYYDYLSGSDYGYGE